MSNPLRFCFVCVCQQGDLEIQSLLLMASLKYYAKVQYELAVAVPQPESVWGAPDKHTVRQLREWGVKIFPVQNPFGESYPIGNKLACLNIDVNVDRVIFLDSDMLCIRPFYFDPVFSHLLCARAASGPFKGECAGDWLRIYKGADMELPSARMCSAVTGEKMFPYFNAGFIAAAPELDFSHQWIKYSEKIDALEGVGFKRPYLDQIAFPLAARAVGVDCYVLDNKYNFPPRLRASDEAKSAILYHYNNPRVASNAPRVVAIIKALANKLPVLKKKMLAKVAWAELLSSV